MGRKVALSAPLADIGHDPNNLPRSIVDEIDRNLATDRIFARPEPAGQRFVDYGNRSRLKRVAPGELAAAQYGDPKCPEVIGSDWEPSDWLPALIRLQRLSCCRDTHLELCRCRGRDNGRRNG